MRIYLGIIALSVLLQATSCGTTYQEATEQNTVITEENNDFSATTNTSNDFGNGYFTVIYSWCDVNSVYYIMYANDTRVKYFAFRSGRSGGITPLYNTDGTLQVQDIPPPESEENE